MQIYSALTWTKSEFRKNQIEGPESSALLLLGDVLARDKAYLLTHPEHALTPRQKTKFESYVSRRAAHEPVWYITGKIEFLGLDFAVNQSVLIPRPETELLVEKIIEKVRGGFAPGSVLDVGTGSGAIILSLADNLEYSSRERSDSRSSSRLRSNNKYFASDISPKALAVAKKNAKSLGLGEVTFRQGDLFAPWQGQKFDLIVANLPYVPHEDMSTLALDLIHYEPRVALDGGHEGLEIYERFFAEVGKHLNPGGKVFCEIGYDQGAKIQKSLAKIMPKARVLVLGDYADVDRIVIIET